MIGQRPERPSPPAPAPRRLAGPEAWRSPLRGPWLTSVLGSLLVPAIGILLVTGFIAHWAYHPTLPNNASVDPAYDISPPFQFSAAWPFWSYAVNQGVHVTLGLMTLPLVLAKLWSVMPRLFERPAWRGLAALLERLSLLLLVGSMLVEFATGILNIDDAGSPGVNFFVVHYYGAWVFGSAFVLHALVKLPTVRRAYRERGVLKPLRDGLGETRPEPHVAGGLAPADPATPTLTRRGLLAMVGGAALTIFAVQVGESIGGPLRRLALLAPRGRVFGTGPNDFPITNTAASRGITTDMTTDHWRLTLVGQRTVSLDRAALLAMPQATHTLSITCTEGWTTTQHWTGVPLRALARLVDASPDAVLSVLSLDQAAVGQTDVSFSQAQFTDPRALLALRVNGEDISLDHGYPARVILPNIPGSQNVKWAREMRFAAP